MEFMLCIFLPTFSFASVLSFVYLVGWVFVLYGKEKIPEKWQRRAKNKTQRHGQSRHGNQQQPVSAKWYLTRAETIHVLDYFRALHLLLVSSLNLSRVFFSYVCRGQIQVKLNERCFVAGILAQNTEEGRCTGSMRKTLTLTVIKVAKFLATYNWVFFYLALSGVVLANFQIHLRKFKYGLALIRKYF